MTKGEIFWRPMDLAPKTGKHIRLLLQDRFGKYPHPVPCKWHKEGWVNAKTGSPVIVDVTGWQLLK